MCTGQCTQIAGAPEPLCAGGWRARVEMALLGPRLVLSSQTQTEALLGLIYTHWEVRKSSGVYKEE